MKKLSLLAILLVATVVFSSCGNKNYKGYKQAENGVYYQVLEQGDVNGKTPQLGNFLYITASYFSNNDSIQKFEERDLVDVMRDHAFEGDIYDAYSIMHEGDHMKFAIKADSFFIAMGISLEQLPFSISDEDVIYFDVKMNKIKTEEDFQQEEAEATAQYIADNNITVEPTASGLYFIKTQDGKGKMASIGDTLVIEYTGKFLDGQTFDSSVGREPLTFVLGSQPMIPGFEEAVQMMNKGTKATILLPSALAYGASNPSSPIPPYSALVFDLEMVDIK